VYQEVGEPVKETENDLLSAFEEDDCEGDEEALVCDNEDASLLIEKGKMCFDDKNDDVPPLCCSEALKGCCVQESP
jgi:hypothetical protein